ncbi:MAG TPA: L,D-transpeptidase family protein, partial [Gammaproteobacteria bacterium]|nr:L,D-transpeptidase family protein [Gammaproteobacteria bacterium]
MRSLAKILMIFTASACSSAYALTFPVSPNNDVVGKVITFPAKYEDTFAHYGRVYDMGAYSLERANPGVDPWIPGRGTHITIPAATILPETARKGIVVNLPELRLFYYGPGSNQVSVYPIGIGRAGWPTPVATAQVTAKAKDPVWTVPKSILAEHEELGKPIPPVVMPGKDNPLGNYALRMTLSGYLIHGTNSSIGVGRRVTHGCIRLFPDDIEALFHMVPVGTSVHIVNEPIKAGWRGNELFLE